MKIVMIGAGYVGLVSGVCFADFGHDVICVEKDTAKIESLRAGRIPIYEPGLEELVAKNTLEGRLSFSTDLTDAVEGADAIFIAVGTPARGGDGHADLTYVHGAARDIARALKRFTVVVTKSTVPVGTGDEVEWIIRNENPPIDVAVASNPEFLREGAAITDFKRPDRIVVGTQDERARAVLMEIYRPLFLNKSPMIFTDRRTAELTKYAANAFLAMKITFINEIADLCERVGADVQHVARGIGSDGRIGSKFLHPGPGYGGSCFPKDTLALVKTAQDHDSPVRLIETTVTVNEERKRAMARKIVRACGGDVHGKTIAILGLTFKPNTDDMREAPSLSIIKALEEAGATVRAYDPEGTRSARSMLPNVIFCSNAYEAAEGASAISLVTEWDQFRALDWSRLRLLMSEPVFIDLRNVYRAEEVTRYAFSYHSIGRPA
ncbi:UDP-glucose/GDP-mannose dehydrogenase family protein [Rhizobium sp. SG570]|uniref:UDP-glucose dehydrogenase family protein n=1 Tax=Rhizobium sp. SG570 TaxID=2587113 RepID=UPI0014473B1A|nr:UDP-glucose/GDP-mannose dehydrogenase family protein [Rhizobium sp. SG570]NKJ40308.1 UDPglucose 6-dehydrogenase [Rhizobium sp. SG570]